MLPLLIALLSSLACAHGASQGLSPAGGSGLAEYTAMATRRVAMARLESLMEGKRRIIGGTPEVDAYPWIVYIFTSPEGEKTGTTCTGSLIDRRWVLTAAHCVLGDGEVPKGDTVVYANCADLSSLDCQAIPVEKSVPHPCYRTGGGDDLIMLQLASDAVLPSDASYASVDNIHGSPSWAPGDTVTLAGYGVTDVATGQHSEVLRAVDVGIAEQSVCAASNPHYTHIDFSAMLCTGGTEGKDSCMGDSGGPAIVRRGGGDWLVGVLSFGSELPLNQTLCGVEGRFGVYTEVAKYAEFVYQTMQEQVHVCSACPCKRTEKGFDQSVPVSSRETRLGSDGNTISAAPPLAAGSLFWTLAAAFAVIGLSR
mmetsp:Transcript_15487/g.38928  ORF Transcript_15487/g.38928 Transcript_15487/m.38928 type:complete len:367 (+) Transcript_15487:48-1148(+)|eukprot:CAMPEP_0173422254 /NCGR_PEP_ID=MMETSP1357-20121228/3031_1 /TAXON_ID=77926 /ORGANISM="Hemiselmis rufescens, Strain PCC563" /LENGTH=366 /DNA_ID=CAMNT_0014385253 /DNA_START=41 /DNA_END=1141 /DNA_ORIENTATION=+